MFSQKNNWYIWAEPIVKWNMEFVAPQSEKEIKDFEQFVLSLLSIGIDAELFRIDEILHKQTIKQNIDPEYYLSSLKNTINPQRLGQLISGKEEIDFFRDFQRFTNLCYFDKDGEIRSGYFSELRSLLKDLRSDAYNNPEFPKSRLFGNYPPFSMWTNFRIYNLDIETQIQKPVNITCSLYSSIWFPFVKSHLESWDVPLDMQPPEFLDNSMLAYCHTERLNRFLHQAKQLTLANKGRWSYELGQSHEFYSKIVSDDGIDIYAQVPPDER